MNRRHSIKYALVIAPMLASCGGNNGGGGGTFTLPPGGITFPDCADGQLVGTDSSGKLSCLSPPQTKLTLPSSCTANTQAFDSDGTTVTCADLAMGTTNPLNTKIAMDIQTVTDLTNRANAIKNGGGKAATYVGVTDNAYFGSMRSSDTGSFTGTFDVTADNGFQEAAKLCAAKYGAGAHMCTAYEIYYSAVQGKIDSAHNIGSPAWIYMPNANGPLGDGAKGYGDTCGGLTYPTAHLKWSGIKITTGMNAQTNRWTVQFHGGSEAYCHDTSPIACCN